ncbi:hypothetical protein B5807_10515 [Epicoccum nigrum]|uniref:Enoyl reductase (ER) domain-containing protein n=1 Tax=Epicoccum nigrum TaxID=105696 RepID=A0A1Y2LPF1_EPING|nr:hypothetical protein B5807_10515 [Epicoccum nigrum]
MPNDMSFEYAAAFPAIGVTTYYGLINMARIENREMVLIHASAGGTGQFCIQIAQAIGAEVYATAFAKNVSFIVVNIDFAVDHKPRLI